MEPLEIVRQLKERKARRIEEKKERRRGYNKKQRLRRKMQRAQEPAQGQQD